MRKDLLRNSLWSMLVMLFGGSLSAKAQDVTATWDWQNKIPETIVNVNIQGANEGDVASNVEGISLHVISNGGKLQYNSSGYAQFNQNTTIQVPVKNAGDVVTVVSYPGQSSYTVGGEDATGQNTFEYTAKASDATKKYVEIVPTKTAYLYSITVVQKAPKEATTLENEAATATFPFNLGTDGQTANFGDDADYFLSSKVAYGSGLFIKGKDNKNLGQTQFNPYNDNEKNANDGNAILFLINPKPGFTFTPTKVSVTSTRFGTDGGKLDFAWQNPDGSTVSLATGLTPNRDNNATPTSTFSYDITGATPAEGQCGLKINLYSLGSGKQVGFCDIIIEGTLSGTEKDMPILASFKINGTEYAADELFEADGTDMVGTFELSKTATMVSESNPLTDITAANGEIGTVSYESTGTSCKVTIPMTAGTTSMNYILNVVQKPDFTLTYIGLDGSTIGTQTVEKDAAIGAFAVDIESVTGAKEGCKARGWFKKDIVGEKYLTTSVITGDTKLYAIETEIEVSSDSKKYTYDLTNQFFYDEDHEGFNSVGKGYWHDKTHGWAFQNGDKIELLVGKKASVTLGLCAYSTDAEITASNGASIEHSKAETDGGMGSIEYDGEAGTLTLTFNAVTYVHNITVLNTTTANYTKEGNTFTVFAGDASSFLDALDAANGTSGSDVVTIYLPNGTYDLGQKTLTTIGRDNITIKGESQDGVVIKNRPTAEGIGVTATLLNTSKYLMLENLTLKND